MIGVLQWTPEEGAIRQRAAGTSGKSAEPGGGDVGVAGAIEQEN